MFVRTTAVNKLLNLQRRKKIIQGGTWAGKTYGIIAILIDYAAKNAKQTGTVVAETIPAIKGGALKDFREIMQETGRWVESRFNATDLYYTFANGTKLEFKSFDSVGKAQAAGKRNFLFINEGPYINYDIADALIMRTSGPIWVDFNPTQEYWAHTELLTNNDAEFLLLKATDNEGLPDTIQNELNIKIAKATAEKSQGLPITSYWQNWCRVYIDGEIGNLQGVVFNNWKTVTEIPIGAELLGRGMDFGFTNDPTTLIEIYKADGQLWLNELLYETGLTSPDIVARLVQFGIDGDIIADSADPKTIAEINSLWSSGTVTAAEKGPDSIRKGIDALQAYKLNITETSRNLIKELRAYRWKVDKSGKSLNEPIDHSNHLIDPARYIMLTPPSMFEVY
jgi:phage terminase large subunit